MINNNNNNLKLFTANFILTVMKEKKIVNKTGDFNCVKS